MTDILLETTRPIREQRIPEVTGQPFIKIWSVSENFEQKGRLTEVLYDLLPAYWQSEGIVDCKILRSSTKSAFIIIESWTSAKAQKGFDGSTAWREFIDKTSEPGGPCPALIKVLANDVFELIE